MDEELREELGVQPLVDLLRSLGGWPVLEESSWGQEDNFKWWEWTSKANKLGLEIRDDIHIVFLNCKITAEVDISFSGWVWAPKSDHQNVKNQTAKNFLMSDFIFGSDIRPWWQSGFMSDCKLK